MKRWLVARLNRDRRYVVYNCLTGIQISEHKTLFMASWRKGRIEGRGIRLYGRKYSVEGMIKIAMYN